MRRILEFLTRKSSGDHQAKIRKEKNPKPTASALPSCKASRR
jgi:hypothetical protein